MRGLLFPIPVLLLAACAHRAGPAASAPAPTNVVLPPPAPLATEPTPITPSETAALTAADEAAGALECPEYFALELRDRWLEISGERYHLDGAGRPDAALTFLPPIAAEARIESCQGDVGRWGDSADHEHDYDGGHLIGSQLGGWGARANMVPQIANFNRGNWLQLENAAAACEGDLEPRQLRYSISVEYADAASLIPSVMRMELVDAATGRSILLTFDNAPQGGPDGTAERRRGTAWLSALGCR